MYAKSHQRGLTIILIIGFVVCGVMWPAFATDRTWDDGSGNHNWSTTTNWNPDGSPSSTDTLHILLASANVQSTSTVYLDNGGSLQINAASSVVNLDGLSLGSSAAGSLLLERGSLSTGLTNLGYNSGGIGTATLSGSSSSWTVGENFFIGILGTGTVNISSGADLTSNSLYLGYNPGGSGSLVMQSSGSTLTTSVMHIGTSGVGTLSISNSADATSSSVFISSGGSATSTATIDGLGSTWNVSSSLAVGHSGRGNLGISGGASVVSGYSTIGGTVDSQGTVLLEDAGSTWDLGDSASYVGDDGAGSLIINSGASVSSGQGYLGYAGTGQGTVIVDGYGSTWLVDHSTTASSLFVGFMGSGTLTVRNRGRVFVDGNLDISPYGTVNVSGGELEIDTLTGDGHLNFTSGTLEVTAGGVTIGGGQPLGNSVTLNTGDLLSASTTITVETGATLRVYGGDAQANFLVNYGSLYINSGGTIQITSSSGLTNRSYLNMTNGTISGSGTVLNDYGGTLNAGGTISRPLNNYGSLSLQGYLSVSGVVNNSGMIDIGSSETLALTSALTNTGTITLAGGGISGSTITNTAAGVLRGNGAIASNVDNSGLIHSSTAGAMIGLYGTTGNSSTGEFRVDNEATFLVQNAFTNSGLIDLGGSEAVFSGGAITNQGTIQGAGRLANAITNNCVIRATGGQLTLGGAATNGSAGRLEIPVGSTVMATSGLTTNAGQMAIDGGTFDNNGRPITNTATGTIFGHGVFRCGSLINQGNVAFADYNTVVYGLVTNQSGGKLSTYSTTDTLTTFFGPVTNDAGAEIKINGGVVRFFGGLTNSGVYHSDPADNYLYNLAVTSTGTFQGGNGDRFFITGSFTNAGTILLDDGSATVVQNGTGDLLQTSGSLTVGNDATVAAGTLYIDGGTIAADGPTALITASLDYTSPNDSTFAGNLSGRGNTLTLDSTPATRLVLSSSNTYTGATTVESGILELSELGQIADSLGVTTGSDGVFQISSGTHSVTWIDGQGTTKVIAGSLTTASIVQDTLIIGSTVGNTVSGSAMTAVPEPSCLLLLSLGFVGFLIWGFRRGCGRLLG